MSLRTKYGISDLHRMDVKLASSVTAQVKSALVEGDWIKITGTQAVSGMPSSSKGTELVGVPVDTTASRLSYPIINNPQSPEQGVPGIGVTVACDYGFIGYTDRYDTGVAANLYTNVALVAKSFTVSGTTRYGLTPASTTADSGEVATGVFVAWGIGIINGELVFRYLP